MRVPFNGALGVAPVLEMLVVRASFVTIALLATASAVEAAPSAGMALASSDRAPLVEPVRYSRDGTVGVVVAESSHGHGRVSGAVRRGRAGYEVRMPGGTWIDCGRSCADTLRRETVDFWESRNSPTGNGGEGRGYIRRSW
jgi:hypothetical protein